MVALAYLCNSKALDPGAKAFFCLKVLALSLQAILVGEEKQNTKQKNKYKKLNKIK